MCRLRVIIKNLEFLKSGLFRGLLLCTRQKGINWGKFCKVCCYPPLGRDGHCSHIWVPCSHCLSPVVTFCLVPSSAHFHVLFTHPLRTHSWGHLFSSSTVSQAESCLNCYCTCCSNVHISTPGFIYIRELL